MRQMAGPGALGVLVAGLVLVAGAVAAPLARAADDPAAWLGVYSQELTPELREAIGFEGDAGVLVSRVVRGSPAADAGLEQGDVILEVGSARVSSPTELQEAIAGRKPGEFVTLNVYRDGERRTLTAQLGQRTESEMPVPPEAPAAPEAPATPEAPRAPRAPEVREWSGTLPDMGDMGGSEMLQMFGMARGRLGVRIESLSPALGSYFSVPDGKGVLVLEVLKDTPAARAGLRPGDVITRVGTERVNDSSDLVSALRGKEGRVTLHVIRKGAAHTIEATLERPGMQEFGRGMNRMDTGPGSRRVIIRRNQGDQDLRAEVNQLKRQIEELQRRLDEQEKGGRD